MPTPTTDFSIFDGQEIVSYWPTVGEEVTGIRAVRRPLTRSAQRNVERYVELQPTDVVFHLDGAPLATTSLAMGDTLQDESSQSYEVLFVERQTLKNSVVVVGRQT
ncbi:MAG: hypothetical protein IT425_07005 [Pirellulales bacterium]|nr:hypothetical protein [Pirellulales bacterium]